jgi:hypothetical protein
MLYLQVLPDLFFYKDFAALQRSGTKVPAALLWLGLMEGIGLKRLRQVQGIEIFRVKVD